MSLTEDGISDNLLNGIKSLYINSLACVRVNGGDNYFQCVYGLVNERSEYGDKENGSEIEMI